MIGTISEIYGLLSERWNTIWECILFVELLFQEDMLSLLYRFENYWFAGVISVSTDSEKYFLLIFVFEAEMDEAEDWIGCGSIEFFPNRGDLGNCELVA